MRVIRFYGSVQDGAAPIGEGAFQKVVIYFYIYQQFVPYSIILAHLPSYDLLYLLGIMIKRSQGYLILIGEVAIDTAFGQAGGGCYIVQGSTCVALFVKEGRCFLHYKSFCLFCFRHDPCTLTTQKYTVWYYLPKYFIPVPFRSRISP